MPPEDVIAIVPVRGSIVLFGAAVNVIEAGLAPDVAPFNASHGSDATANMKPGSFIIVKGSNLASTGAADQIPPPTLLGGSCVTLSDVGSAVFAVFEVPVERGVSL